MNQFQDGRESKDIRGSQLVVVGYMTVKGHNNQVMRTLPQNRAEHPHKILFFSKSSDSNHVSFLGKISLPEK